MAGLDGMQQNGGTSKTVEQLLHSESPKSWNANSGIGRVHDQQEDEHLHHGKKLSVFAKVKEKAKKWRQTITKKKILGHDNNGNNNNHTPSWGVALEDYEVEDEPENNHESLGDESQHQKADQLTSEKNNMSSNIQCISDSEMRQKLPTLRMKKTTAPALGKSHSDHVGANPDLCGVTVDENPRALSLGSHLKDKHPSPSKFTLDALIAQRNNSDNKQKEKPEKTVEALLSETTTQDEEKHELSSPNESNNTAIKEQEQQFPTNTKTITEAVSEKLAPVYNTNNVTDQKLSMASPRSPAEEHKWDKGVSVKEYLKYKLEPGEDEKALSKVITDAISPKLSPSEKGVVEKVKNAMTMLLQSDEPSSSSSSSIKNYSESSSSQIVPVSTNDNHEEEENKGRVIAVEEANKGRVLQAT